MTGTQRNKRVGVGAGIALLALMLLGPLFLSGYWMRVLTGVFMYAIFTQGINIIAGYCGYPAFGNVVFFGTGAYGTAVLMVRTHVPFVLAVPIAMALSAALALLIGPAMLRLRGGYFAIGTVGVMLALQNLTTMASFTGGASGLRLPVVPWTPAVTSMIFYYTMGGLMLAGIAVTRWIAHSKFGYGLRAIRDSSEAAEMLGVNTARYRSWAWAVSALFSAAAGGVYAYWMGFLEPPYAYDITISLNGFLMMVLGGSATVFGPVVGAAFLQVLSELVWDRFEQSHLLVLGAIVMLVSMYLPGGVPSLLPRLGTWLRSLRGRERRVAG